ncbi:MAG: hypothetical protein N2504_03305 [candidate division WOR-3 bacterium]|nr:hypothetical protein [candidate division WOR-3 bacterium]MCX7947598.1 hypothetical protein [candidate division WOR-3 bacterium]MDW8150483.1 hypothetical protein [candidate division WOR-3 bacterium]
MLDTIVVIDTFRYLYKIDSVYKFGDFREVYRVRSNIVFRELSNRIVVSIRGLEDKQNEIYLENIKLNSPIWGFFYTNVLPLNLISNSQVFLNDYRISLEFSKIRELGVLLGSYGKSSIFLNYGNFGIERTYNENNFKYWDSFNREYFRKNNFEDKLGGYVNYKDYKLIFYSAKFGMPLRGYGNEGNDFERVRGFLSSHKKFYFSYQFYQYNHEKPYESYSLSLKYFESIVVSMKKIHQRHILKVPIKNLVNISLVYDEGIFRYDYNFSKTFDLWSFTLDLSIKRRLPNFSELYYSSNYAKGDKFLNPENFYSASISYLFINTFITYIQNPILWLPENEYWIAKNEKYLLLYGIELNGKFRFLNISASYIENKLSKNRVLPYRPKLNLSAKVIYNFSEFLRDEIAFVFYSTRPRYYYPSSEKLKPILIIDYYKFFDFKSFFVYLYFKNLLNKSYEFIAGYPMESFSINIKGGVRW